METARKWVLPKHFDGFPNDSDFELVEEALSELKDGEILTEAIYLSVDPYMRAFMHKFPVGTTIIGQQVAKVIESKHDDWDVGSLVLVNVGWRDRTILDANMACKQTAQFKPPALQRVSSNIERLSPSTALGTIGMTGATAYFGILEVLKPSPGETLFVNAAAGAVGNVAGQIGKILGCRVIGCASTKEKCDWLRELGFDYVYNYKECDNSAALTEGAPDGIDCFFENVGGEFSATVVPDHMNKNGRVVICGFISGYNDKNIKLNDGPDARKDVYSEVMKSYKREDITVQDMEVYNWFEQLPDALDQLSEWVKERKIKIREHVTEGFENMPRAFIELFTGANIGKAVVRV